ncbi:hypothetical protein [Belnapia sp. F-4-1]|uniref:hypothetical protein n=1 Tax=Belnapia sp. F-4-1 TaxID=1545443 RepID=UPI0011856C90|nr:hypothetical protein [Belnapia sp. F-4-1]
MTSQNDRRPPIRHDLPWQAINPEPRWAVRPPHTEIDMLDYGWAPFEALLRRKFCKPEIYRIITSLRSWEYSFPGQYGKDLLLSATGADAIAHFNCAYGNRRIGARTEQNRRAALKRLRHEYILFTSSQIKDAPEPGRWQPKQLFDLSTPSELSWGKQNRILVNLPYYLKAVPVQLKDRIDEFLVWRSSNSSGKIRLEQLDGSFVEIVATTAWTNSTGQPSTESHGRKMFLEMVRSFGGFATLPADAPDERHRGLGIPIADLKISHLMQAVNFNRFLDFKTTRRGRSTGQIDMDFLRYSMLMNGTNGYLRFAQRSVWNDLFGVLGIDAPKTSEDWIAYCDEQMKSVRQKVALLHRGRSVKSRRRRGRASYITLKTLLDYDRPLEEIVWPTILYLEDERPNNSTTARRRFAHEYRIFLLAALTLVPLRASNWTNIKWTKNLFLKKGRWKIYIDASEFKNRRSLSEDYAVDIGDEGQRFFSAYYEAWMQTFGYDPLLPEHRKLESFVLSTSPYDWDNTCSPPPKLTEAALTYRLRFLEKVWNLHVGPHAFRHITATDWLKRHPGDYTTVAGFLNDSVETVEKHYSHVTSADHYRRVSEANGGIEERARAYLKIALQTG